MKSYLSNTAAVFWTFAYPIAMLVLLIMLFDRDGDGDSGTLEGYRAVTAIGLISLTVVSTAIFGMGQALCEMRSRHALLPYYLSPVSLTGVALSIIASRVVIVIVFSVLYLVGSFAVMGVDYVFTPPRLLALAVVLLAACLFSFALALILAHICRNAQTMIAVANILNLYAIMSSDVFIPRAVLPEWSAGFVTTSPFFYLNEMLRMSFGNIAEPTIWMIATCLATLGLGLTWLVSRRSLFLHSGS